MQNLLKYCASPGIPIFTGRPEHSVSFFLQFGNAARAHGIQEMFKPPSERHQVICEEVRMTYNSMAMALTRACFVNFLDRIVIDPEPEASIGNEPPEYRAWHCWKYLSNTSAVLSEQSGHTALKTLLNLKQGGTYILSLLTRRLFMRRGAFCCQLLVPLSLILR